MPASSSLDSSSVALSVTLLSFDAIEACGLCSEDVEVLLVADEVTGLLAVRVLGLVEGLFRLEAEGAVADVELLAEEIVGLLNLSVTDAGRVVDVLVNGFDVVLLLTVLLFAEPVVAAVLERLMPGVGADSDSSTIEA